MKIRLLITIFGIIVTLFSCESFSKNDKKEENKITENFDDFYRKFYSDSLFQENRIIWPLKGKILEWHEEKDSVIESAWKKNDLSFMLNLKDAKQTKTDLNWDIIDTPNSKIEKLYIENSGFFIEREFKVKNGKWYLIRYDISNL